MPTPAIHTMGGALAYLLTGNLGLNRVYIVVGVLLLSNVHDLDFLLPGPHRGFTHSLLFCLVVALLVGYFTKFGYLGIFTVLISHLLLDSLANGWNTVSWLWPVIECRDCTPMELSDWKSIIKHTFKVF